MEGQTPDCRRVMPWERVSDSNDMLHFMKKLIQLRKDASGIIQHGSYSLKEIKPDVYLWHGIMMDKNSKLFLTNQLKNYLFRRQ